MRAPAMCAFGDGAFDVDPERADVGIGPYGVRSAMVHPTQQLGTGGHLGRPYGCCQFRSGTTVERTTWVWVVPKCCIRATS